MANMQIEAMKLALEALEYAQTGNRRPEVIGTAITALRTAIESAQRQQALDKKAENARELGLDYEPEQQPAEEPVAILPDGSAFGVMSFPLPSDHWLYAPNEYRDGEYEPIDLPKPILTHALRDAVVAAVRYAVRGATMRGQEMDFDPDALVQNSVYALCGPYTTPPAAQRQWVDLMDEEIALVCGECAASAHNWNDISFARAIEAKLREKNGGAV